MGVVVVEDVRGGLVLIENGDDCWWMMVVSCARSVLRFGTVMTYHIDGQERELTRLLGSRSRKETLAVFRLSREDWAQEGS